MRRNARERSLANDPKNASAWDDKGRALTHLRRYDEAIECFNQALAVDPQYVNSMVNRGTCYAFTQRYAQARQRYDQARQVRLDVEEIYDQYDWTGQGLVALAKKRYDQAIACFDKAIAINASYHRAWYGKGKALQASAGRFDRARQNEANQAQEKARALGYKE